MLKTPEDYLSDLNFDSPLPDSKNAMLDSSERVFVEKYLGLDILEAMPLVYQEQSSPSLPVLNYEKSVFPVIEIAQEPLLKVEEQNKKIEILEKTRSLQICVVPDEPVTESVLLDTGQLKEDAPAVETRAQEEIKQDVVQTVIPDVREDLKQDIIEDTAITLGEDAKETIVQDVIAEAVTVDTPHDQEYVTDPIVNKVLAPSELALQATAAMREKLRALTEVQIFSFCIAKQVFLLPVPCIQEVIKYTELVKVPQAPGFIAGAINLRGNVIPLIFLSALLTNETEHFYDESKFVIVCGTEQARMGLIVDKINGMHFLTQDKFIWNAEAKIGDAAEYLYAIANFDDHVCGLVAPELITQKILES